MVGAAGEWGADVTPLACAVLAVIWTDDRDPSPILAPPLDGRAAVLHEAKELAAALRRRRGGIGDRETAAVRREVQAVERWMRATPQPAAHPWALHVVVASVLLAALDNAPRAYGRLSAAVGRFDAAMARTMPRGDYYAATRAAEGYAAGEAMGGPRERPHEATMGQQEGMT